MNREELDTAIEQDRILVLPAPIGTVIYKVNTDCGDFCRWQDKLTSVCREYGENITCDIKAICHTIHAGYIKDTLELDTLPYVLPFWGDTIFASKEEAISRTQKLVAAHRVKMLALGFEMDNKGYSSVKKRKKGYEQGLQIINVFGCKKEEAK
ncbi:MAG: hypothetical protein FWH42_01355 [Dehalococcoidia bacterium]|nr:hypothetical protein [Dehalococcoidia bacterium]